MANSAPTDVEVFRTIVRSLSNGRIMFEKTCRYTATNATGTVANAILASSFGLQSVEEVSNAIKNDDAKIFPCAPSADNSQILVRNPATGAPIDITAAEVVYLTVRGY